MSVFLVKDLCQIVAMENKTKRKTKHSLFRKNCPCFFFNAVSVQENGITAENSYIYETPFDWEQIIAKLFM